ncbi:hypothetical protein [Roseateles albus]|uniref:MarR family transcriptional regulator n=1 Tax=Roseateles albus TaxID=2987525 RepID=A0ABT5KGG1_9BURK|nr:hypothetical protein [Roseateles albus]MDC8773021.1 hypothetical protein [Roseateles albus]
MNRHLIDHMLRVGRQLTDNDYEAIVIWGVLAHQNIAHMLPPGGGPSSLLNERGRITSTQGMRPLRLRDVTQIARLPRETVRRKLEKLATAGWIERQSDGWVICADHSAALLRELSRENVRRFLSAADDVLRALKEADTLLAAEKLIAKTSTSLPAA